MLVGPTGARKLIGTRHGSIPGRESGPDRLIRERQHATSRIGSDRPGVPVLRVASAKPRVWTRRYLSRLASGTSTTGVIRDVNE
jgi:hypothetical protein